MNYVFYVIFALLSCFLFLPRSANDEIRNVPILISVLSLIALYCIYRLIRFIVFTCRVKHKLNAKGFNILKMRFFLGKCNIIAENDNAIFDIYLLRRKKSYYRYHFDTANVIEFYKSSFAVSRSSKKGTIARTSADQKRVGKQKTTRIPFSNNKTINYFTVIDKFPYCITDATHREEINNGDHICSSDVILFDINGFIQYLETPISLR